MLILFAFIVLLPLAANGKDPDVKISGDSITIQEAFATIEEQTEYTVAYSLSKINPNARVLFSDIGEVSLASAMGQILKGTGCSYVINGSHIILVAEAKSWGDAIEAVADAIDQDFAHEVRKAERSYATRTMYLKNSEDFAEEEVKGSRKYRYLPDDMRGLLIEHIDNDAAVGQDNFIPADSVVVGSGDIKDISARPSLFYRNSPWAVINGGAVHNFV